MNNSFQLGFEKSAGMFSSIDDFARAANKATDDGINFTHKFDKKQFDELKKIIRSPIKPIHLLGASILAGAGFPIGQYVGAKLKGAGDAIVGAETGKKKKQPYSYNYK